MCRGERVGTLTGIEIELTGDGFENWLPLLFAQRIVVRRSEQDHGIYSGSLEGYHKKYMMRCVSRRLVMAGVADISSSQQQSRLETNLMLTTDFATGNDTYKFDFWLQRFYVSASNVVIWRHVQMPRGRKDNSDGKEEKNKYFCDCSMYCSLPTLMCIAAASYL